MAEMERKINFLMKVVEERDHEITALREQMRTRKTAESSQTPIVKATDKGENVSSVWRTAANYFHGNPKQHIAHFVETCENAGSRGDQLVRQFIRSLKGNAFEWYTDLEPEVINSWKQLEKEFLNRFYSFRRTVSMMELTNTKQRKGEPVIDYINRWRALSLDCKDRLTELSTQRNQGFPIPEVRKDKKETKGAEKVVKSTMKESMVVNTTPLKFSKRKEGRAERKDDGSERRRLTLKERQETIGEEAHPTSGM
ncbi:retrotransposon gag protein [Cucumis melo var. makuwa]|uniref:Retrotransposon gag protein n=1 Tax=Cucumis melo var. makuwa TaxID=1194695 RepID=A0A5D3BCQ0_CUCMM|nr:retrotransposon gag protein [Cucumis melo var. makuwa]TYJ97602.1 retrotransposon gag protein [Cucumis melo var. makuwa]